MLQIYNFSLHISAEKRKAPNTGSATSSTMSRNFLRRISAGLRHAGHMFCFSLLFVYLFLMIPVRPIISKIVEIYRTDIRQIIGVGRTLAVDDKSDFFDLSSYVAMATTFCWFYPQN